MHHLMGAAEIGERLGLSRQRVQQLVSRPDFPKPEHELIMGKVWRTADVEAWIRTYRPDDAEDMPAAPEPPAAPMKRRGRGPAMRTRRPQPPPKS